MLYRKEAAFIVSYRQMEGRAGKSLLGPGMQEKDSARNCVIITITINFFIKV